MDHIDHVVKIAGIDSVGIGTDFDGGGGVEGCNEVSQMFRVTEELVRRGYTEEQTAKIWGGNIMRVLSRASGMGKAGGNKICRIFLPVINLGGWNSMETSAQLLRKCR